MQKKKRNNPGADREMRGPERMRESSDPVVFSGFLCMQDNLCSQSALGRGESRLSMMTKKQ